MFKSLSIAIIAAVVALSTLGSAPVDAKKFGGGKSVGSQRSAAADRPAGTPSAAPSAPNSAAAATAAPAAAGAAAAAAKPSMMSRMAGPLAGIAAGIGLGYLFSKMGAGGFLGLLLIVGLAIVAAVVIGRMMMKKSAAASANGAPLDTAPRVEPMQYAGAGAASGAAAPVMASGLAGGFGIPAGFDKLGFEENAKKQFMTLQAANDKGDLDEVRNFATDEFYNQIAKDVITGNKDATQVDELHAELLGVETERNHYWASVEFTGKMREDGMVMPSAFREVWNLVKPVDGSKGWLLAGIQQV
jgi:predicted lipid-binding transport protein (Tim44 family)